MTNKRERWIDIAKGIGITLVLIDHSQSFLADYVSWFHLVIFFTLSGYLFKPVSTFKEFKPWAIRRTLTLLVPYLAFLLVITFGRYIVEVTRGNTELIWFIKDFFRSLYGGRYLGGIYAPFWFITCLIVTQLLFAAILLIFKSNVYRISALVVAYILAHIESSLVQSHVINFYVPWAADVSLIALAYYGFGYYLKNILNNISLRLLSISLAMCLIFITLNTMNLVNFQYELKYIEYTNLLLDFIVPTAFTVVVLGISQKIDRMNIGFIPNSLSYLGITSLVIMYLHFPTNIIIENFTLYGPMFFIVLGLLVPSIISFLVLERSQVTKLLFLGKLSKKTAPSFTSNVVKIKTGT